MKKLSNQDLIIKFKSGLQSDINTTATKNLASVGEPHYPTDSNQLYIYNGTENVRANRATYADYNKTSSGNLPTTYTKLDYSGAILSSQTEDLFDAINSRIKRMPIGTVGKAIISMSLNTTSGTSHWVDMQLRGFDSGDVQLFAKRAYTKAIVKSAADSTLHIELEFYFGANVEYFEIWHRASSAFPFSNPDITVIRI